MTIGKDIAPVVVLGAGLSGASTALELASRSVPVILIERDPVPFNRASLRNEGKIHLGFIYANDATRATARFQLYGGLHFAPLMERWLGVAATRLRPSTPFHYLVMRDSVLTPERLEHHYAALQRMYGEALAADDTLHYFGRTPARLYERVETDVLAKHLVTKEIDAVFRTDEIAIDTATLAACMREALASHPSIELRTRQRVASVRATDAGYAIEGDGPDGAWRLDARQVVNCCWEDRLRIDDGVGLAPEPGWLHRLKYRVIVRLPEALRDGPSITMVLGPYGDVVVRDDGTAYCSWYPLGLRGWTHDLAVPAAWGAACSGDVSSDDARETARQLLDAIDRWYPGVGRSEPLVVDAGAIVSYGTTDVDDPASGLHDRTRIGVRSHDGYHSLEPGKLTTAPFFGVVAADRVMERV